jgi:predicted nucleic acid-binding protein
MRALLLCRRRRVSFGDALIWAAALASGVKRVYTLDARFPEEEIAVGPPEDPGSS